MSHWTTVLFHRRLNPHDNTMEITTKRDDDDNDKGDDDDDDDDVISICSVMDIILPRLDDRGKRKVASQGEKHLLVRMKFF